jgi:crotonobetainyl-CoA:carnitine CoA-transferase CaiB-like acyl-CoA transferase
LRARGFLQPLPNALLGEFPHQATPISFSRSARPMFAAPRLGEHNEMICRRLLGFTEAEFAALREAGVFV